MTKLSDISSVSGLFCKKFKLHRFFVYGNVNINSYCDKGTLWGSGWTGTITVSGSAQVLCVQSHF